MVDDCTRESLARIADTSLLALRVARELDRLIAERVKPMQNGFIESFNSRLRDLLFNETRFSSLAQARTALNIWRADYNGARPHSKLRWQTPDEFALTFHTRRSLALHATGE